MAGGRVKVASMALLAAVVAPAAWGQGVQVAMVPATQTVAPNADFELSIEVPQAGSAFNAFDLYVGFNPAAVTPLPTSPTSMQEGTYFKAACPNRFHLFKPGADRDTITDVLLCSGTSVTGPGQIYRLRFRAASTSQVTTVRFLPGIRFYDAGVYVNPIATSDATIQIATSTAVLADMPVGLQLSAAPNPSRGSTVLTVTTPRAASQQLCVYDVCGRLVRHLQGGAFPAGTRLVSWDGRTDAGTAVRAGLYLAALHGLEANVETRIMVLQ